MVLLLWQQNSRSKSKWRWILADKLIWQGLLPDFELSNTGFITFILVLTSEVYYYVYTWMIHHIGATVIGSVQVVWNRGLNFHEKPPLNTCWQYQNYLNQVFLLIFSYSSVYMFFFYCDQDRNTISKLNESIMNCENSPILIWIFMLERVFAMPAFLGWKVMWNFNKAV